MITFGGPKWNNIRGTFVLTKKNYDGVLAFSRALMTAPGGVSWESLGVPGGSPGAPREGQRAQRHLVFFHETPPRPAGPPQSGAGRFSARRWGVEWGPWAPSGCPWAPCGVPGEVSVESLGVPGGSPGGPKSVAAFCVFSRNAATPFGLSPEWGWGVLGAPLGCGVGSLGAFGEPLGALWETRQNSQHRGLGDISGGPVCVLRKSICPKQLFRQSNGLRLPQIPAH